LFRYQKEAAKVTQDLEACASEVRRNIVCCFYKSVSSIIAAWSFFASLPQVAYEAFSLVRTIRAYGVEMEETVRQYS